MRLGEIKDSLERERLQYSIAKTEDEVVLHAWGRPKRSKRKPARRDIAPPAPTLAQCLKRLEAAKRTLALTDIISEVYEELFAEVEHWAEMVRLAETLGKYRSTENARRAENSLATEPLKGT